MNWPQSSYSSSNSSSVFGGQQPSSSGYGTPAGGQQQQQSQGMYGGGQQQGFGTPGGNSNNLFSSPAGFQSIAPSGLQQQTFSTSSPHQQQQQQHQQPQHMMQQHHTNNMHGIGYQSQYGNSGMGSFLGGSASTGGGLGQPGHQQQMMMSGGGSNGYGQYQQQPQQIGAYGSPQAGASAMQGSSGAPSTGVGRYLPGYLTASSLSGSPRQSTSSSNNHDGRLSPEQSHRDTGGSFGAGSSRLFASSTSSAGTAGRESPSRSPKQSLFSSSAYGSSRSLALTPATGSRPRRTSSNNLVRPSHDEYMEEDAPPVDTLDDFDNDAGVPYVSSPPPTQPAPLGVAASPTKRQIGLHNGSASSSSAFGQASNGQSSSSHSNSSSNNNGAGNIYKLIVFGYPPNLQSSVLKEFSSIAPLVYNSIQDPSPSSTSSSANAADVPPTGSNWFTIAYDNDWAAMRALRKNGDIIAGSAMIGVKWADSTKALDSGMDLIPSSSQQQQSSASNGIPRSSTASNLGTPATVLPASQAFLPKPNANGASAMRKSATLNKINEMGKIDPSIFKQPQPEQQKQGGGVVNTLTNLIFGF